MGLTANNTIIVILAFLLAYIPGAAYADESLPDAAPALLGVATDPAGARIYINGTLVGASPFADLELTPGEYVVKADMPGLKAPGVSLTLQPGEEREVFIRLADARGGSWFRPGSFWAGVGVGTFLILAITVIGLANSGW